jgi:hypothetical protein
MTTLRQFRLEDTLRFNLINLDVLTETYNGSFQQRSADLYYWYDMRHASLRLILTKLSLSVQDNFI